MRENIAPITALVLSIILIIVLSQPLGQAPALGPFLSPSEGFLQNRERSLDLVDQTLPSELTGDSCTVIMDSLLVPHIFAGNEQDAYRLQGYLTAKYRLWQMDFITRVAAGRLSEVIGPRALAFDKNQRRKGLATAAAIANEAWKKYPISYGYLEAYSEGVNAYLTSMSPADWPIEFKLLGYEPESWSPLKSALFFKHMSDLLCSREMDFEMTNARQLLDESTFKLLYPERLPLSPPVIPSEKRYGFGEPNNSPPLRRSIDPAFGMMQRPYKEKASGLGSNNWAVAPVKTENGWALLANDPHLPLTLPSIWYMLHIHTPDRNVMGVSLPGVPSIILGFNDHISWGITNVGQDVLDWMVVDWDKASSTYQWGDETRRIVWEVETIQVKGKDPVIDSVAWTEFGPIWKINTLQGEQDAIMRWIVHEVPDSDEMSVFPGINKSENWQDFQLAVNKYNSPPQNFIFASKKGDIGLQVQGRFPFRVRPFGRFLEKARPQDTWKTHLPEDHVPSIKNPSQGYLASANQVSTDSTYPYYYLNADFRPSRARTINKRLQDIPCADINDMMELQLNNHDVESHSLVNTMLPLLSIEDPLISQLEQWNGNFEADCELCPLVEMWKRELNRLLYDELLTTEGVDIDLPSTWTTIELLRYHPRHKVFDNADTEVMDTANNIVSLAFANAKKRFEALEIKDWKSFRNTRIAHIIPDLKSFGHFDISSGGVRSAPNALQDTKGPSWRFVDQLDEGSYAYGVYPGGQSGNPGSRYYDNLLQSWIDGKYLKLYAAPTAEEVEKPLFNLITSNP